MDETNVSPEIQSIYVYGAKSSLTAGSYKLGFAGFTTSGCIAYNADESTVAAAIDGMDAIVNVSVTASAITNPGAGTRYEISFATTPTGDVPTFSVILPTDPAGAACDAFAEEAFVDVRVDIPGYAVNEVQSYVLDTSATAGSYKITFDGEQTTACFDETSTTVAIAAGLTALSSTHEVAVTSVVDSVSVPTTVTYSVTFSGAAFITDLPAMSLQAGGGASCVDFDSGNGVSAGVVEVTKGGQMKDLKVSNLNNAHTLGDAFKRQGTSPGTSAITPLNTRPTGPTNVSLTVVSGTSLGVSWQPPYSSGGPAITKYKIEWDSNYNVARGPTNPLFSHVVDATSFAASGAAYVAAGSTGGPTMAGRDFEGTGFQYKIGEGDGHTIDEGVAYWVRVSAFNSEGYSDPVYAVPTTRTGASQFEWAPGNPVVHDDGTIDDNKWLGLVTTKQMPHVPTTLTTTVSHLDINDQLDLTYRRPEVNDLGYPTTNGGAIVTSYIVEYDTSDKFNSGNAAGTQPMGSYEFATWNNVGTNYACDAGQPCEQQLGAEIQSITTYNSNPIAMSTGSFKLRFTDSSGGTETSPNCLAYDISGADLRTQLKLLAGVDEVLVSREAITTAPGHGFRYRITFTGTSSSVVENVEQLEIVHKDGTGSCEAFADGTDVIAQTDAEGGQLVKGTMYHLRVRARNAIGTSPPTRVGVDGQVALLLSERDATPRAPPNPPPRVRIYAHTDDGTKMRIWWTRPTTDNGGPISDYVVEWTDDSGENWGNAGQLCNGGACPIVPASSLEETYRRTWTHESVIRQNAITTITVTANVATVNHAADADGHMLSIGGAVTFSGMAENVLNSNYVIAPSMNPTSVNFQILLNDGALADGTYFPDAAPGDAFVAFDLGGVDGWDYNITGLTAGTTYAYRVVARNDQGRGDTRTEHGVSVSHVSSTEAVPLCQGFIEDCQELLVPRRLPLAPTSFAIGEIGTVNEFTHTSIVATWKSGGTTDNVANFMYKVEWDTLPTFDSTSERPMSYEAHGFNGTSPEVAESSADANGELYYDMTGLPKGVEIYVRITGKNTLGYGAATATSASRPMKTSWATTNTAVQLRDRTSVTVQEYGTGLDITWTAPLDSGGDPISKYRVEWGTAAWDAYTREKQTVSVPATTKPFRLALDTASCATCQVRAPHVTGRLYAGTALTAAKMKVSLENLPNIEQVDVTRTDVGGGAFSYAVTFVNEVADMPEISVHTQPADATVTVATNTPGTTTETVALAVADITIGSDSLTVATCTHAAVDPIKLRAGDKVTMGSFTDTEFNQEWTVTGTPTKTTFTIDPTEHISPGAGSYANDPSSAGTASAVVSGGYCES